MLNALRFIQLSEPISTMKKPLQLLLCVIFFTMVTNVALKAAPTDPYGTYDSDASIIVTAKGATRTLNYPLLQKAILICNYQTNNVFFNLSVVVLLLALLMLESWVQAYLSEYELSTINRS